MKKRVIAISGAEFDLNMLTQVNKIISVPYTILYADAVQSVADKLFENIPGCSESCHETMLDAPTVDVGKLLHAIKQCPTAVVLVCKDEHMNMVTEVVEQIGKTNKKYVGWAYFDLHEGTMFTKVFENLLT